MLFKVRWAPNNHIYTVYSVKSDHGSWECAFLVYEHHEHEWRWLDADDCEPVEDVKE